MKSTASKAGRILVVLALLVSIGAHWAVLRSVAWTQMLVERSQISSFREAVKTTFDGNHPCDMCRKIDEEQHKEHQQKEQTLEKKTFDVILVVRAVEIQPPHVPYQFPVEMSSAAAREERPAIPPPRCA